MNSSIRRLIIIAVVLGLFLLVLGLYFKQTNELIKIKEDNQIKASREKNKYNCQKKGSLSTDEFLEKYIVKSGDTLLSISKSQLGSTSRISEIIVLNKNKYPGLSIQTPFIEQGWTLLLPPKELLFKSSDVIYLEHLMQSYVLIAKIDNRDGSWILADGKGGTPIVKPTTTTKFIGQTSFKEGDCVIILHIGTQLLSVKLQ